MRFLLLDFIASLAERVLPDNLAYALARKFCRKDLVPEEIDVVFATSHGATQTDMTNGTKFIARTAADLTDRKKIKVYSGEFSGNPIPGIELKSKEALGFIPIGKITSTIDEAQKMQHILGRCFLGTIVLITDQTHSQRCRMIWKVFFPQATIAVIALPSAEFMDTNSPMRTYHSPWRLFVFQMLVTPIFWVWCAQGEKKLLQISHLHQPLRTPAK